MYSHAHGEDLLQERMQKQNQQREKVRGVKAGGSWAQASKSLLPMELPGHA